MFKFLLLGRTIYFRIKFLKIFILLKTSDSRTTIYLAISIYSQSSEIIQRLRDYRALILIKSMHSQLNQNRRKKKEIPITRASYISRMNLKNISNKDRQIMVELGAHSIIIIIITKLQESVEAIITNIITNHSKILHSHFTQMVSKIASVCSIIEMSQWQKIALIFSKSLY